jgi:hypothetical protein
MHRLIAVLTVLVMTGAMAPAVTYAKEGSEPTKVAKKSGDDPKGDDHKTDDKNGRANDDDSLKTCYVFTSGGKIPRPAQHYITKGDLARIQNDDYLKKLSSIYYSDDTAKYPENADDSKSYNPRLDQYNKDDRLGAKACILL